MNWRKSKNCGNTNQQGFHGERFGKKSIRLDLDTLSGQMAQGMARHEEHAQFCLERENLMDQIMSIHPGVGIRDGTQLQFSGRQEQIGQQQVNGSGRGGIDGHGLRTALGFPHVIAGMFEARGAE